MWLLVVMCLNEFIMIIKGIIDKYYIQKYNLFSYLYYYNFFGGKKKKRKEM